MFRYSLRSALLLTTIMGVALATLCRASVKVTLVLVLVLAATLLVSGVLAVTASKNRSFFAAAMIVGCGYLLLADGGLFPAAPAQLPTEWLLGRVGSTAIMPEYVAPPVYSNIDAYMKSGYGSLVAWACREYLHPIPPKPPDADDEIGMVDVQLPTFTFVTVPTTTIAIPLRFDTSARSFLLTGHCWFAAGLAVIMGLLTTKLTAYCSKVRLPDDSESAGARFVLLR